MFANYLSIACAYLALFILFAAIIITVVDVLLSVCEETDEIANKKCDSNNTHKIEITPYVTC